MNRELARKVADAVLYEGYMLYPYRPSAIKNRQRWTFGILYPPAYSEVRSGTERSAMHSECLLATRGDAAVEIELRFLHLVARQIEQSVEDGFVPVTSLVVDGGLVESWEEGVERSVKFELTLEGPSRMAFSFAGSCYTEPLRDKAGSVLGRISRTQQEVAGTVSVSSEQIRDGISKLVIDVANESALPADALDRNAALPRSLLSANTVLMVIGGEFVSLLDPPEDLRDAVSSCRNVGNFPVLLGDQNAGDENKNQREMLFCSPILLYDYPQVAPESAGDFFDSTEMDEMLTLRVMTLTDQEKDEMRLADNHVRKLLQRTEQSAREQLMRTHGTIRGLRAVGGKP